MTVTNAPAAENWLREQLSGLVSPSQLDEAFAMIRRAPSPVTDAPSRMLIQFPDTDGRPVFFDPLLVVAIREDIDKSRNVRTSLVTVAAPGSTSVVLRVMEGAQLVGDRINLARRGLLARVDDALKAHTGARELVRQEGDA